MFGVRGTEQTESESGDNEFDVVNKRKVKFMTDYFKSCNSLCMLFASVAQNELDALLYVTA